ncbi:MAG TPA: hypothetical protein VFJ02_15450 [Vicinamibacterales bacterium]|nr:hypothetical protein [Vicinamibacterales bacterium]
MKRLFTIATVAALTVGSLSITDTATSASELAGARERRVEAKRYREVTVPAGTILRLRVTRGFGSDISQVEDSVTATLARPVVIAGRTALPVGSNARGYVVEATRPGKVKGRGRVAVRFNRIEPASDDRTYAMQTRSWVAVAPATKKKDALTIGIPAAGGALVGALVDGKKGAGIGAAAGGGAGTAVVLTTRGKDVRIGRGALLNVRLNAPLTVRVAE